MIISHEGLHYIPDENLESFNEVYWEPSSLSQPNLHIEENKLQTIELQHEPTLELPKTPQRSGKRQIKRTHPVSEGNIENMIAIKTKKEKLELEKQTRKKEKCAKPKNRKGYSKKTER